MLDPNERQELSIVSLYLFSRQLRERSNEDKHFRQRIARLGERLIQIKMSKASPPSLFRMRVPSNQKSGQGELATVECPGRSLSSASENQPVPFFPSDQLPLLFDLDVGGNQDRGGVRQRACS